MRRRFLPFYAVVSVILAIGYGYIAWRLAASALAYAALAVPFLLIWLMPLLYWRRERERSSAFDRMFQWASFVSMAFLSFLLVLTLGRDILLLAVPGWISPPWVVYGAALATFAGVVLAFGGPRVKHVDVPLTDLPEALVGLKIAQISDLHVGPTIRAGYVRRVVARTNALRPDLVALTGDIVDGRLAELKPHAAPLGELAPRGRVFFVMGNHEYYTDGPAWIEELGRLGMTVLQNDARVIEHAGARVLVGGVVDPAARMRGGSERPDAAAAAAVPDGGAVAFRLLLAHQPKIAAEAAAAGFDLQLSGHTHGGQFFPWTLVVRFVHEHYHGLGRSGRLWVYVSPGTGSWGPPVRLGTLPEITLLRLVRAGA